MSRELEQGTLTKNELREQRWVELSERCRFALPAPEISEAYLKELARHAHLIEGAVDVCRTLAPKFQLGIVTNGFEAVQTARLAASPLRDLIDFMVTSETAGAAKPAPAVFELALERSIRPVQRERVLVVGDGIISDIAGGQRMGFATCWFNPTGPCSARHRSGLHDHPPDGAHRGTPSVTPLREASASPRDVTTSKASERWRPPGQACAGSSNGNDFRRLIP